MRRRFEDASISALYDGEANAEAPSQEALAKKGDAEVAVELEWFRRLSAALEVPADLSAPDPNFVARFRARRDELSEAMGSCQRWRRLTVRLVPLASCALLTTGLVIWASNDGPSALRELEVRELGDGLGDLAAETTNGEPVLRIAFGEL